MANTTSANVILIAPEFDGIAVSAGLWTLVLSDVQKVVIEPKYAKDGIEIIQRYLAAHFLTKIKESGGENNQSESVEGASFTKWGADLLSTKYGCEADRLMKSFYCIWGF